MRENLLHYLRRAWDHDDPDRVSAIDELPLWSAPFGLALLDTVAYRPNLRPLDWTLGLIRRTGFEVVECRQQEFSLRFASGTAMLNHSLIRIGFLDGWKTIVPEPDQGPVFARVEDRLNELADRQRQLCLTIPFVCIDCHKPL